MHPAAANATIKKFDNQLEHADGKILSVRMVGSHAAGTSLDGRIGGTDGLGLIHEEGSVDILIDTDSSSGSKLRSDSLIGADPRAKMLVAPPGANSAGAGGASGARMDID